MASVDKAGGTYDLIVIGGGVNGCGIARDAAGRGLKVLLCEKGDLASATSSASTKLFHGGLRYLEYFEFRLVREALIEREVLLRAMPHISWPLRFIVPYDPDFRLENDTSSLGKLLRWTMPFLRGKRPAWLIRTGLFMYDHLGGRKILPGTRTLNLRSHPAGKPLAPRFTKAFEYSDCWVEDSRLVVLMARDAAERGARILTRTACTAARREDGRWRVRLQGADGEQEVSGRILVNAAGPWVEEVLNERVHAPNTDGVRLVRGSHIVTRRLFDHDQPYFFQLPDGRIIFAIPYETDFTLIGTTEADHEGDPGKAECTPEERAYLLAMASRFFRQPVRDEDVVWTYSGVRPLYDDHASSATAATRDYVLKVTGGGDDAPLLSVFGGKITTHRRLAEHALEKLQPFLPAGTGGPWTADSHLPGGDFPVDGVAALVAGLRKRYPFLDQRWALRLVRAYGTEAADMLGDAEKPEDLGRHFGWNLTEREVVWLRDREFAQTADDILWRRSKIGLRLSEAETNALREWMEKTAA